jgi:uncharacterized membrane protein
MADTENKQTNTPSQGEQQVVTSAPVEQVKQAADQMKQSAQQAGQVAGEVAGQFKEGAQQVTDQLKNVDIQKMFKAAPGQPAVTQYERLLGGVSYIPFVPIVTLVLKGDSNYVKLHGRQSLAITIVFILCMFLYILPYVGFGLAGIVQFGLFILGIYSMYQALVGNWWKIPVLGDIAEMIPIGIFVAVAKEAITGQPKDETTGTSTAATEQPTVTTPEQAAPSAGTAPTTSSPDQQPPAAPTGV